MKVLWVKLYLGEYKMTVLVEDRLGNRRLISSRWVGANISNTPPESWLSGVQAEVSRLIQAENNKKSGRLLF